MNTIILASASPRRKEILGKHGIPFQIQVSDVDESHEKMPPAKLVEELSKRKAKAVFEKFPDKVVLGADTVVAYEDEILEKPKDDEDAYRMISLLQGNVHQVYTGVTICSSKKETTFSVKIRGRSSCEKAAQIDLTSGESVLLKIDLRLKSKARKARSFRA